MTLRTRLALVLCLTVTLGAALFGLAARESVERALFDEVDRELISQVSGAIVALGGERPRTEHDDSFPFHFGGDDDGDRPGRGGRFDDGGRGPGPFGLGRRGPAELFGRRAQYGQVVGADGDVTLSTTAAEAIGGLPAPDVDDVDDGVELRTVEIDDEDYRWPRPGLPMVAPSRSLARSTRSTASCMRCDGSSWSPGRWRWWRRSPSAAGRHAPRFARSSG